MGTPIPDSTDLIDIEESDFGSAVSESFMQKLGGGINNAINTASGFDSDITALEGRATALESFQAGFGDWTVFSTAKYKNGLGVDVTANLTNLDFNYKIHNKMFFFSIRVKATSPDTVPTAYLYNFITLPAGLSVNTSVMGTDPLPLGLSPTNNYILHNTNQSFFDSGVAKQPVYYSSTVGELVVTAQETAPVGVATNVFTTHSGVIPLN